MKDIQANWYIDSAEASTSARNSEGRDDQMEWLSEDCRSLEVGEDAFAGVATAGGVSGQRPSMYMLFETEDGMPRVLLMAAAT